MTAKGIAIVAAGLVGAAGAGGAIWYSTHRPQPAAVVENATLDVAAPAPPPPAVDETLDTAGPKTLILRVVNYKDTATLEPGSDSANTAQTLEGIFSPYKLQIVLKREAPKPYPAATDLVDRATLDSLALEPQAGGDGWKATVFMLRKGLTNTTRGIMLSETSGRDHFAVFTASDGTNKHRILRTAAHELGHTLNLFHNDADGTSPCEGTASGADGTTLMNQERRLDDAKWLFKFGPLEEAHLKTHPLKNLQPGTYVPFGLCIQTHQRAC